MSQAAESSNNNAAATAADDALISQFMAFTGSSDAAKAASYLEMSGNNVETAVGLFLEHQGGGGGSSGGAASAAGAGDFGAVDDEIRAPDATRTMRLMEDDSGGGGMAGAMMMMGGGGGGGGMNPAYHLMNAMMDEEISNATASAFGAEPTTSRLDARAALDAAIAAQQGGSVNPLLDSYRRASSGGVREDGKEESNEDEGDDEDYQPPAARRAAPVGLSDMFSRPSHLMHTAGGFQGARSMAKDTKRWLLINIQRDSEFSSHALNRDVWRDELVENLVREGFIFWQQGDSHPEGRTYTERYQVRDYPHIGIIDPRTGRLLWRKEGWTQENPMTPEMFAERAMDFCSRNTFDRPPQAPRPMGGGGGTSSSPAASRPAKRPVNEMSEADQMQAAMRASMEDICAVDDDGDAEIQYLASDNEDDDEVQVVDSKPAATATNAQEAPPAAEQTNANEELLAFAVPPEPASGGSRIQFRLPDGKKVVYKFGASDSVRAIYAFIAQNNEEARSGREFIMMAGYPPHDLISDIENTIEGAKLKAESITVRWK